jgi:DNA polymerase-3 subunit alpha (Gram-positive type)
MAYVVVDIETTGLSKSYHKITEIGAVRVVDGEIMREFHTLVNPQQHIPSFITRLTGINDAMVKDAPPVEEVLPGFVRFLGDDVFVAHNATFDFGFLSHNCQQHHNLILANDRLCTRKLANRLLPDLPSKRLDVLCRHFEITNAQHHRAMADAHATALVLNNFLEILKTRGITQRDDILRFERSAQRPC